MLGRFFKSEESLISFIHLVGDWPSKLHQSPVSQALQGSGKASMATVAAQKNTYPAVLAILVSGYCDVEEGLNFVS